MARGVRPSINVRFDAGKFGIPLKGLGQIRVTVKGEHVPDGLYSKRHLDAYELAEIQTYGLHGPKRPFFRRAKDVISRDPSERRAMAESVKKHLKFRKDGSAYVEWGYVGRRLVSRFRALMRSGRLNLAPLAKDTERKRERAGYYGPPLYASGELAKCIAWERI